MSVPRVDIDRMVLTWSVGDEDAAVALMRAEGFAFAPGRNGAMGDKYRTLDGWERRLVYVTERRAKDREREQRRRRQREASCED